MNNPQAFPRPMVWSPETGAGDPGAEGMTLRDYFAAAALTGLMGDRALSDSLDRAGGPSEDPCTSIAEICYMHADAMLAQRMK